MGDSMRALKIATIVMGVLIVAGTTGLIVVIAHRLSGRAAAPVLVAGTVPASVAAVLDEPAGTRIAGIVAVGDRLALQLQGGGVDRVVLIDPATGAVTERISLAR
jgi:putative heme iron utilization protein